MKANKIPESKFKRILCWTWRQKSRTNICPDSPSLEGKIVAITGGTRGIGLETVKGLLKRGAEVIVLSRNKKKDKNIIRELRGKVYFVSLDLGNIKSIRNSIEKLEDVLMGREIDVLINNAGMAVKGEIQVSPQGYELSYAVNVLGHHILFQECHRKSLLSENAHIIAITGDIYFLEDDCTANFVYIGNKGVNAYSRSKLGVMWWALKIYNLYPQYKINIVHPGVIPMGLGANQKSIFSRLLSKALLTPKEGAQTTLICVTQADIENGAYYHNALGKATLPESDPVFNLEKADKFWKELEDIYTNSYKNDFSLDRALA